MSGQLNISSLLVNRIESSSTLFISAPLNISGMITMTSSLQITGSIGLGISPGYQLDLSTDGARKLTTNTWLTGSDSRVKTDIQPANLEMCIANIKNIPLRRYTWSEEYAPDVRDRRVLGWIAQEVKEVLPKAVSIGNIHGITDFHTLNPDEIYKMMYGAVQYLIQENEKKDTVISDLIKRIENLEKS
jgi:hypothetical protein